MVWPFPLWRRSRESKKWDDRFVPRPYTPEEIQALALFWRDKMGYTRIEPIPDGIGVQVTPTSRLDITHAGIGLQGEANAETVMAVMKFAKLNWGGKVVMNPALDEDAKILSFLIAKEMNVAINYKPTRKQLNAYWDRHPAPAAAAEPQPSFAPNSGPIVPPVGASAAPPVTPQAAPAPAAASAPSAPTFPQSGVWVRATMAARARAQAPPVV